jgi:hypothetical protein
MNVIELLDEMGVNSKCMASTHGGEYHSPCPECGGTDRFCVWPKQGDNGRYWCRQCQRHGDAIQFCRDFWGMSYQDACRKVGRQSISYSGIGAVQPYEFSPSIAEAPCQLWQERAETFIKDCHQELIRNPTALSLLHERGLTIDTATRFRLGYNAQNCWEERKRWGLSIVLREDGKLRKQWLPRGLVIPAYADSYLKPIKLKIRRSDWYKEDNLPKYAEISGSQKQYAVYGEFSLPIVIVESELDALLIEQEAAQVCCVMALGGAGKHPDAKMHELLRAATVILFSLDFDEAGKKAFAFWRSTYFQVIAWPSPLGKSPADAFQSGLCLSKWILEGVKQSHSRRKNGAK